MLKRGKVVALCGADGCMLLCDASNGTAVQSLRERFGKPFVPFRLVLNEAGDVEKYCAVTVLEKEALALPGGPVVLVVKRRDWASGASVSPSINEVAVSLPGNPALKKILSKGIAALAVAPVKGAGLRPESELKGLADYFLPEKSARYFDSPGRVLKVIDEKITVIRRGAQEESTPFALPANFTAGPDVLALGADEGNTVCVTKESGAFLSRVHDDIKDSECFDEFLLSARRLKKVAGAKPSVVAHDIDRDSLATIHARGLRSVKLLPVQRQFAHVASCMLEHGVSGRVLGVVYDQNGRGEDGNIWGAEFLSVVPEGFERLGHLRNVRWPDSGRGDDMPWRIALAYIYLAYGYNTDSIARELFPSVPRARIDIVCRMLEKGSNLTFGSSMGSFFEAMAAITGICVDSPCARNAASMVEMLAFQRKEDAGITNYPYEILDNGHVVVIDPAQAVNESVENILAGKPREQVAARFMATVVDFTLETCERLRGRINTDLVVLTGGVFENRYLAEKIIAGLGERGFRLLTHRAVPCGDGGVSLGQAYVAKARYLP